MADFAKDMKQNTKTFHVFSHISGTTGPIRIEFGEGSGFGHGLEHLKFQPHRLKNARDGWLFHLMCTVSVDVQTTSN